MYAKLTFLLYFLIFFKGTRGLHFIFIFFYILLYIFVNESNPRQFQLQQAVDRAIIHIKTSVSFEDMVETNVRQLPFPDWVENWFLVGLSESLPLITIVGRSFLFLFLFIFSCRGTN